MIWWIRNFKAGGQYLHSCLWGFLCVCVCAPLSRFLFFFLFFFLSSPCWNPHFSNEYKYLFCECLSCESLRMLFKLLESLCRSSRLQRRQDAPTCVDAETRISPSSLSLSVSYCDCLSCNHTHRIKLNTPSFLFFFRRLNHLFWI